MKTKVTFPIIESHWKKMECRHQFRRKWNLNGIESCASKIDPSRKRTGVPIFGTREQGNIETSSSLIGRPDLNEVDMPKWKSRTSAHSEKEQITVELVVIYLLIGEFPFGTVVETEKDTAVLCHLVWGWSEIRSAITIRLDSSSVKDNCNYRAHAHLFSLLRLRWVR